MRRPGPDEWTKLVAEYEASGLQQKEFCAKHDLSLNTLQYWLYRKSRKSKPESGSATKFLPVTVVASSAPKARLGEVVELALRSGVVLRFGVGTDSRYLAELAAALG